MGRVAFNENISPSFLDVGRPGPQKSLITEAPQGSLFGAAFRQENPVTAAIDFLSAPKFTDDPEFELEPLLQSTLEENPELERSLDSFIGVRSQEEFNFVRQRIEKENQDRALLAANGVAGIAAAMAAGLLSPTILLPGGALVRGATTTRTALKTSASVAGWAMVGASIDEGILYTTQETRTGNEVMLGIGTAAVLGGILGGAAGGLSKKQITQFERDMAGPELERTIHPLGAQGSSDSPQGLSAQVNPDADRLENAGGTLKVGIDTASTFLTPGLRNLNQKYSDTLKWFQAQLSTSGMYLEGNLKGIPSALGGEVAELAKQRYTLLANAVDQTKQIYKEQLSATTRGNRLDQKDFNVAIGRALERGQQSENPFVEKAANVWREELFLPMYRDAKAAGLRGFKGISEDDAVRYLPRILRQGMVQRDEKEFIEVLEYHITKKLTNKITNKIELQEEILARRQEEVEDLSLDAEGATELRADLETRIAKLPEEFDEEIRDMAQEIRDLREDARVLSKEEAKALRERANLLETENKERLAPFSAKEKKLRQRFARLDATRSGYEKRQQRVLEQITRLEDQQLSTLDRAMRRAQKLFNKLDETDPKFEQKVAQVRAQIERAFRTFSNAEGRLDKMRGVPEGFEELVTSDVRPTDKISKLEDRQRIREEALDDLFARLDELENPENRDQVKELLGEQIENLQKVSLSVNNKRALRLAKLRDDVERFTPERQRAMISEKQLNLRAARESLFEDIEKKGGRLKKKVDADGNSANARFLESFRLGRASLKDNISVTETAREMARDLAAKMTGEGDRVPALAMLGERGPELARTLDIDATEIVPINGRTYEDFLERDVEKVARRYLMSLGPDIELFKRFGTVNPMQADSGIMQRIRRDFDAAKDAVEANPELSDAQKQAERQNITKALKDAIDDIETQIGRLRHQRGAPDNPNSVAWRAGRAALNINVLRLMGGVVISSLPDLGGLVMRHGYLNTFGTAFSPLVVGLKAMRMSAREARIGGVTLDLSIHGRASAIFDTMDEVEHGSGPERMLQYATNQFGKITLIDRYNFYVKNLSANLVLGRMTNALEKVATGKARQLDLTYLAANGIDGVEAQKLWREMTETPGGSDVVGGVRLPNTANWKDRDLARAFSAALGRQVDGEIVTPGIADRPNWMDGSMVGRLVGQFRSFTFSSQSRLLIAAAQEARIGNGMNVLSGVTAQLALGTMAYYLWAQSRGEDTRKEMQNASPEKWAIEALTRSGLLGVLSEVQMLGENIPATNSIATFGTGRTSRASFATPIERAAGPTAGLLLGEGERILNALPGGDPGAIRRVVPLQNVSYLAWLFDLVEEQFK